MRIGSAPMISTVFVMHARPAMPMGQRLVKRTLWALTIHRVLLHRHQLLAVLMFLAC